MVSKCLYFDNSFVYLGFYPLKENEIMIDKHSGEGLKIMALGDVNNDKHIDMVTVNNQQDHFTVHFFQEVS